MHGLPPIVRRAQGPQAVARSLARALAPLHRTRRESLTRLRAPPPTARRLSHHSLLRSLWHALHWRRSPGFPLCAVTLTARGSVKSCPCAQVVFGGSLTPYASALVVIVSPGYQRQRHGMMASWPS